MPDHCEGSGTEAAPPRSPKGSPRRWAKWRSAQMRTVCGDQFPLERVALAGPDIPFQLNAAKGVAAIRNNPQGAGRPSGQDHHPERLEHTGHRDRPRSLKDDVADLRKSLRKSIHRMGSRFPSRFGCTPSATEDEMAGVRPPRGGRFWFPPVNRESPYHGEATDRFP